MGYGLSQVSFDTYVPSADIIASNDVVKAVPATSAWVLVKEIALVSTIGIISKFRYYFEGAETGGGDNRGRIYRNGVAIGTISGAFPGGGGYTAYTEDINTTNFVIGDKIQLYGKADNAGCSVRYFRILGVGSEWANTLV